MHEESGEKNQQREKKSHQQCGGWFLMNPPKIRGSGEVNSRDK